MGLLSRSVLATMGAKTILVFSMLEGNFENTCGSI